MTLEEKAVVEAYTGYAMCCGDETWARYTYAQQVMARPVWTHEWADKQFVDELQKKSKPDFIKLCKGEPLGFELEGAGQAKDL